MFSLFENTFTIPAETAAERPENMTNPSPKSVNLKVKSPPKLMSITAPKPRIQPASFTRLNFSVRNIKVAHIIVKNSPSPFNTEDLTPEV